jgi:hypothetical protein
LKTLGWHIGFWNLIGGIGFTLCPALGFGSKSSAALEYASALSTFLGSWAFLVGRRTSSFAFHGVTEALADFSRCRIQIGSVAQWYESLDKYTVSVEGAPPWLQLGEKAV